MPFWNRNKNWEDEYDEDYIRDRRLSQPQGTGQFWFVPHVLAMVLVGGLFLGSIGVISGKTMVEKMVTSLATPTGVVWLTLLVFVYFSLLTRKAGSALIGFFCWLLLTVGGNEFVSNLLIQTLEKPYEEISVFELEPFDQIVLLGGGTGTSISGRAQGRFAGDRVILAAQMYHSGLAKQIVCTGTQKFRSTEKDLHPREEAADMLLRLKVPRDVVFQMQGENTYQEMQNLSKWLDENQANGIAIDRVGIVTSAWHMSRAIRLAQSNGLDVEPVPADFMAEPFSPQPSVILPSSENLLITSRAMKEFLAGLVGR
ncbi:MAG: YdcF family protein [Planctomycetota bacterium]